MQEQRRSVVVTGAGSGIGRATAQRFVDLGCRVWAADLDPGGVPDGTEPVELDVRDEDAFARLLDGVVETSGRLDVLCNNAGRGSTADPLGCTVQEWEEVFAVNATGTFIGTRHALRHMLPVGDGVIVNVASAAGMVGLPDRTAYCASKGAVIALTKQVAVQYAAAGIRCNCVCPGTIDSPWVGRLLAEAPDPAAAREALVARQPMGRLGHPDEVAAAIVYLAGAETRFMTGTALVLDGGIVAG